MSRARMPLWLFAGVTIALLAPVASATAGQLGSATATGELAAAATRYEAENAVCQGTVDSDHAGFSGTGFCNTTNAAGAYVEWTVTSATAGTATLSFRHANGATANRPADIAVNGTVAEAGLAFGSTGAWSTWETVTVTVPLGAGVSKIRATGTTSGGASNLDYLDVEVAEEPPPPAGGPYEAEDATISQGVAESNHAGFSGTGFVNYDNVTGSYVQWTVTAATAGKHTLRFRYANGTTTNRPMDIAVNGALAVNELSFAGTGVWSTWRTSSTTVSLQAGTNTVRATATTANGGPNVDNLEVDVAGPSVFKHPGVLVSRTQLDRARQQALAGAQPWKSAYDAMRASSYASLSWTPKPREIVECGPSSNPNYGCSDERNDALAAYTHGLLWYITRDSRHAQKSIQIMDAWSAKIRDHTNHNAPLQTGWAGASFARAGELIRHTYSSWPNADRFARMLRDVYLPEVINGKGCYNGNWELIMMDASIGIAVFLDDKTSFDKAVRIWRGRVPAYVYQTGDGSIPKAPPNCPSKDTRAEIIAYWQGQETFVDGLAQETCRDFGHTGWGLAAAVNVAETAWHQGVNLYGEMSKRLTDGMYFHARYELGATVPSWLCGGSVKRGFSSVTEVAFNHFHNRLGYDMPTTQRYTESKRPANANYFRAWETLTHANNP
ncbi:MAG: carbohydrate-binding protein [Micromonosporaceae bacterium]